MSGLTLQFMLPALHSGMKSKGLDIVSVNVGTVVEQVEDEAICKRHKVTDETLFPLHFHL